MIKKNENDNGTGSKFLQRQFKKNKTPELKLLNIFSIIFKV